MVLIGYTSAQYVPQISKHGHEGQALLVDELLPGLFVVALRADLRLDGERLLEPQPLASFGLIEVAGQMGGSKSSMP